jgi:hypothetical protein
MTVLFKTIFILIILMFPSTGSGYSNQAYNAFIKYDNLNSTRSFSYNGFNIKLYAKSSREINWLNSKTIDVIDKISIFYESESLSFCDKKPIEIYLMNQDTLNNKSIMPFLLLHKFPKGINGIYATSTSHDENGSLFISNTPTRMTSTRVLVHEMVHYWQDMNCELHPGEAEAAKFEKFYFN